MTWPISWPAAANIGDVDPSIKALCELYAGACMTSLTLHRAGGNPVTIMPAGVVRGWLYRGILDGTVLTSFYPGTVYPSALDLHTGWTLHETGVLDLPGPVGAIVEVRIGGAVLDADEYRVENGRYLVRLDGGTWPVNSGDDFTVKYHNSHPVDEMGAHAGGIMAMEWLKLITGAKGNCRLPKSVTNIQRQGLTMELARGMFPDGVTGMPEVDAYIMLLNPFALKVMPRVYSLDLPEHRQVWNA